MQLFRCRQTNRPKFSASFPLTLGRPVGGLSGVHLLIVVAVVALTGMPCGGIQQIAAQDNAVGDGLRDGGLRDGGLRVGGYAQRIDPRELPVPVNGGFVQQMGERVIDPLAARTLVIADGESMISITVIDSCLLPRDLIDDAKTRASQVTGIPIERMMVSATHAHSVPAAQGIHGTEASEAYRDQLREQLADSIIQAHRRLRPAEVGWGRATLDKFVYCRRWLMQPGTALTLPFTGREANQVQMNPGHGNPNKIRPVGPVDTDVMVLAFRSPDGKPLAVLGNFNTHYAGAPAISSDYFGHFCRKIGPRLGAEGDEFVALISNGTSGDANCIDFSQPTPVEFDAAQVAEAVMDKAQQVYQSIDNWQTTAPLRMEQKTVRMDVRMPTDQEVESAREATASWIDQRLPQNAAEVYQRETLLLSDMPPYRDVVLQAITIGQFAILTTPCEVYGSTGLYLKQHSPLKDTMNIGWANDYLGYLPPPDHFKLGGYTTWRARSSCLEEEAEPKLREHLLTMLRGIAGNNTGGDSAPEKAEKTKQPEKLEKNEDPGEVKKSNDLDNVDNPAESDAPTADRSDQPSSSLPSGSHSSVTEADQTIRQSPIDARESLREFVTHPDVRIELVACEPQTIDPVSAQFDAAGQLWVVEMRDYPDGPIDQGAPRGRIRVLRDQDADGFFESATTFAEGLEMPTGLTFFRNGVIVTIAGKIVFMEDTDGDNRCDHSTTWFAGFSEGNEQLRANHPTWILDNRIHVAAGLRGGEIVARDPRFQSPTETTSLAARDFQFSPLGGEFSAVAGNSQFGFFQDSAGQAFVCENRHPCRLVLATPEQASKNPMIALADWIVDVMPAAEQSRVYALTDAWTTSNLHAGQFTAACGVYRYQSDALAPSFSDSFFACEPTGNLVQRFRGVDNHGRTGIVPATERGRPGVEFLASRDPWFRPVDLTDGPDGAIYVVDMHRAVIEHPDWVPDSLKQRRDERWGDSAGRIYRLLPASDTFNENTESNVAASQSAPRPQSSLADESDAYLSDQLGHANRWRRTTAARLLAERLSSPSTSPDPGLIEILRAHLASDSTSDVARSQLLWLLESTSRLQPADLALVMKTAGPTVRRQVARLSGRFDQQGEAIRQITDSLAEDSDPRVRFQWLMEVATGRIAATSVGVQACIDLAMRDQATDRKWIANALSLLPSETARECIATIVTFPDGQTEPSRVEELLLPLCRRAGWDRDAEVFKVLIESPQVERMRDGYLDGLVSRGGRVPDVLASLKDPGASKSAVIAWESLLREAAVLACDDSAEMNRRLIAIRYLMADPQRIDDATLAGLIAGDDERIMLEGLRFLVTNDRVDSALAGRLVARVPSLTPQSATTAVQLILRASCGPDALLAAVEDGQLPIAFLDPNSAAQLQRHGDMEIRRRATELVASRGGGLADSWDRYRSAINTPGDPIAGKELFARNCAVCHKIDGAGHAVGPDISDLRTQTAEQLLHSILDPSAAIDANYFRYACLLLDGRIVEGLLVDQNAQMITLVDATGQSIKIPRDQIELLRSSGKSMMPEGFERQLPPAAMNDLIAYLMHWRLVASNIPVEQ
jgi:putative membrane-bound dehydrogenase-like protein